MKKIISYLIISLMALLPVSALNIDLNINVDNPKPELWISDRIIFPEDREGDYALSGFPGEEIKWDAFVRYGGGADKIVDLFVTKDGNDILECNYINYNGFVDFANTQFNPSTDRYYRCTLSVAPQWHGLSEITTIAQDILGNTDSESFNMFFNPEITLSANLPSLNVNGLAGQTVLVATEIGVNVEGGANAEISISGTDFYDSRSFPTRCPTTNQFLLTNIEYAVDSGSFNVVPYQPQPIGIFNNNFILNFRINIPSPCLGSFDRGDIILTGEIA